MDVYIDGWMDGRTGGQMDRQTDIPFTVIVTGKVVKSSPTPKDLGPYDLDAHDLQQPVRGSCMVFKQTHGLEQEGFHNCSKCK